MVKSAFIEHPRFYIILAMLVLIGLAIAYQPVLFNFFCSDDFYIVSWLDAAQHNIASLFQTVYEGTPYYRPVLNLLLFLEYIICGANSLHFRLFSLTYLLFSAVILYFLIDKLIRSNQIGDGLSVSAYCLFSIGFFLLYPLHTEPVNWFVSTTELLANLFILSSFLLYLYWRNTGRLVYQLVNYIIVVFAFLTKEVSVILPAILFTYEFLLGSRGKDRLLSALDKTKIYWLLLGIYLCLRKIMTGNFLGNWSDSVFHFSTNQIMYKAWLQSLRVIFVPLSSAIFGAHNFLYWIWIAMILFLVLLTIVHGLKMRTSKLLLFLVCWFFISLLPMAKLLLIMPDLLDARYGYIASVPLCIFLMYGLAGSAWPSGIARYRYPIIVLVLSFSCFILHGNNLAWAEAGQLTNSMLNQFKAIHKEIADNCEIYFLNIPIKYKGIAIAGLKSIDCMNRKPFVDRDHANCIWLLDYDQSLPIGLISEALEKQKLRSYFYYLSDIDKLFHPVNFATCSELNSNSKHGIKLSSPTEASNPSNSFFYSPLDLKCQAIDAIILNLDILPRKFLRTGEFVRLTFENDFKTFNDDNFIIVPLDSVKDKQSIVFNLRGIPMWDFGGHCHLIKIQFPKGYAAKIKDAYAISIANLIPKIIFHSVNYDAQSGQLNLNSKYPQSSFDYDAHSIKNCIGIALEVIGGAQYFPELNSRVSVQPSMIDLSSKMPEGKIGINRSMFAGPGYYKVRLRPIDKDGKQCGLCSDHFIVYVSP